MNLQAIETLVLQNIGYDRYSSLSVDTDAAKIEDFAMLHKCVNMAREEIKLNTNIADIVAFGTAIVTASGISQYALPIDFDIPVTMYYALIAGTAGFKLTRIYPQNLPSNISLTDLGTPESYIVLGNTAGVLQIYLLPTPNAAGVILPLYKPVLAELILPADEDSLMKKYSKAVIDFASAFAFQFIKKDGTNHDKYYGLGMSECSKIALRDVNADSNFKELPSKYLMNQRTMRMTK